MQIDNYHHQSTRKQITVFSFSILKHMCVQSQQK